MSDRGQDLRLLEALLFASAQPLEEPVLASRLPEGADVSGLLAELVETYRNRGVTLEKVAGGWTFRTAADLAPRLMLERLVSRKLSRAAIETLAIIAYHQPVTRTEIEEIRGVVVNRGILDTLMESGWIRPKGHKQTPGRPATWVTTPEFLVHFGLDGLADLPGIDELKAAGLLDPRPAASLTDMVADSTPAEPEDADDDHDDDGADDALDEAGDEHGADAEALAPEIKPDPPARS
jgi:segregation and condensation protein B